MHRLRKILRSSPGALLAAMVLLSFAAVHLFHFHLSSAADPWSQRLEQASGAKAPACQCLAGHHPCPVCSLLAHSCLAQAKGLVLPAEPGPASSPVAGRPSCLAGWLVERSQPARAPPLSSC
jgi:hypothetical protein